MLIMLGETNRAIVYKVVDGTFYRATTSPTLIEFLERSRRMREKFRLQFVLGDPATGLVWEADSTPMRGFVGRSTGDNKIPLLVRTRRSLGGEAIMDDCIVQLRESPGGCILWDYRYPQLKPYQLVGLVDKL